MTGFASVNSEDDRATISVTIRALNNRHLDLQLRIPQVLAAIESDVRTMVAKVVSRGRVELGLSLQLRQPPGVEVEFNDAFGTALEKALDQARSRGLVTGTLTPGDILRLLHALTSAKRSRASGRTCRIGSRSRTAPSRAGASSTFCCRK